MKKTAFRADINGLRAVAVFAVLLYHFGMPGFGGGFVGVDVFFVISGYLMTQIIAGKLAEGRFSLLGFYDGRVRRILPALTALCALSLAAGYLWLIPSDYKLLGHHVETALTFYSNVLFAHKSGYFERGQREQWLVHTWSLSVEWQFYLVYPLFLMALRTFRRGRWLKHGILGLFAASLLAGIGLTPLYPNESFYLLHTRMWEFLAGGMSFFFPTPTQVKRSPQTLCLGLGFIICATVFYTGDLAYPGAWATLPVLGTVLAIEAQAEIRLLENRIAQFFGDISYSLYLWHWPVFLGAKYLGAAFGAPETVLLLALSVLLATLSYRYVETPFRHAAKKELKTTPPDVQFLAGAGCGWLALVLAGMLIYKTDGMPARMSQQVLAADQETADVAPRQGACMADETNIAPDCVLGAKAKPSAALWGDSHADMLFDVLDKALLASKRSAQFFSHSACPPVQDAVYAANAVRFGRHWRFDQCRLFNKDAFERIMADPHIRDVFLSANWSGYVTGMDRIVFKDGETATDANLEGRAQDYTDKMAQTMCALEKAGKRVYVVEPVPDMPENVPVALARARLLHGRDVNLTRSREDYAAHHEIVLAAFQRIQHDCGIRLLDPRRYLCDKTLCQGIRDGRPLYRDDNHLSSYGSSFLLPLFRGALASSAPYGH